MGCSGGGEVVVIQENGVGENALHFFFFFFCLQDDWSWGPSRGGHRGLCGLSGWALAGVQFQVRVRPQYSHKVKEKRKLPASTSIKRRYKPGLLDGTPPFIIPHQPRLDWQMWFAALGSYQHNPW